MDNNGRALMIVNPISGTRSKAGVVELVKGELSKFGMETEVLYTRADTGADVLARRAIDENFAMVVAAGGDGTLNRVASALCNFDIPLGILPFGSGNGLARTLSIPLDVEGALKVILEGNVVDCDHGTVNDIPFFCTCGIGFDAAVARKFAGSSRRGRLTYVRSTFEEYLDFQPDAYALEIDGKILTNKAFLIAVCNIDQYGNNVYVAPGALVNDGLLDITVIHAGNPISTAMAGLGMLTGFFGKNKLIECFRTSAATITRLRDDYAQIDGEPVCVGKRLDVKCVPGSLKVFAPKTPKPFTPVVTPVQSFFEDAFSDLRLLLKRR